MTMLMLLTCMPDYMRISNTSNVADSFEFNDYEGIYPDHDSRSKSSEVESTNIEQTVE